MSTYGTHQTVQTPALRAQVCPLIVRYLDCVGLLPGLGRQSQRPCPAGVSRVRSISPPLTTVSEALAAALLDAAALVPWLPSRERRAPSLACALAAIASSMPPPTPPRVPDAGGASTPGTFTAPAERARCAAPKAASAEMAVLLRPLPGWRSGPHAHLRIDRHEVRATDRLGAVMVIRSEDGPIVLGAAPASPGGPEVLFISQNGEALIHAHDSQYDLDAVAHAAQAHGHEWVGPCGTSCCLTPLGRRSGRLAESPGPRPGAFSSGPETAEPHGRSMAGWISSNSHGRTQGR
jgi:hypothetical protein